MRHGMAPSAPMIRSCASAQTRCTVMRRPPSTGPCPRSYGASYCHRRPEGRVMLVTDHAEVLEPVIEQRGPIGDLELRERVRRTAELLGDLVDVVVVDVAVATDPDEVTRGQPDLSGDHPGEQRIAGDVERH